MRNQQTFHLRTKKFLKLFDLFVERTFDKCKCFASILKVQVCKIEEVIKNTHTFVNIYDHLGQNKWIKTTGIHLTEKDVTFEK